MNEEAIKNMRSLKNIGPTCAKYLCDSGIDTPKKLKGLGAKEAFLTMFEVGTLNALQLHPCYLYALQGAIDNVGFNEITENQKEDFKKFCKELRASVGG